MKIVNETKLDFDDILLVPQRSMAASRKDVDLNRTFNFYHSPKDWQGTPIIAANMDTTGSFAMGAELSKYGCITCLHKHNDPDKIVDYFKYYNIEPYAWISVGMPKNKNKTLDQLHHIERGVHYAPNICIDIANGYTDKFCEWCSLVRKKFPESIIMAGNVCTPEMVQELILHGGVDIVKVGIGPGSACTTRLKTGVGYPQLSAIIECSHAAHGLKSGDKKMGLICADGGCRQPADVCKAFAAGADFVMLGGMLAGTEECEGEWEYEEYYEEKETNLIADQSTENFKVYETEVEIKKVKKSLLFYGMSSEKAQEKHSGGMKEYKSSEGRVKKIDCKGPVQSIINDVKGGLRSCCAYLGATEIKDLPKCAKAVKVNRVHFDKTL
jgi:GMP reductase